MHVCAQREPEKGIEDAASTPDRMVAVFPYPEIPSVMETPEERSDFYCLIIGISLIFLMRP